MAAGSDDKTEPGSFPDRQPDSQPPPATLPATESQVIHLAKGSPKKALAKHKQGKAGKSTKARKVRKAKAAKARKAKVHRKPQKAAKARKAKAAAKQPRSDKRTGTKPTKKTGLKSKAVGKETQSGHRRVATPARNMAADKLPEGLLRATSLEILAQVEKPTAPVEQPPLATANEPWRATLQRGETATVDLTSSLDTQHKVVNSENKAKLALALN